MNASVRNTGITTEGTNVDGTRGIRRRLRPAIPTSFAWDFGDGARTTTHHHGRPWTRRRPGNIGHVYETRGRYDVTATIVFVATGMITVFLVRHVMPFFLGS